MPGPDCANRIKAKRTRQPYWDDPGIDDENDRRYAIENVALRYLKRRASHSPDAASHRAARIDLREVAQKTAERVYNRERRTSPPKEVNDAYIEDAARGILSEAFKTASKKSNSLDKYRPGRIVKAEGTGGHRQRCSDRRYIRGVMADPGPSPEDMALLKSCLANKECNVTPSLRALGETLLGEKTYAEIIQEQGCTKGALKTRLSRLKKGLLECKRGCGWSDEWGGEETG